MMERRKGDILCVLETKWLWSNALSIRGGFKLFYHGVDGRRNGVGVILKKDCQEGIGGEESVGPSDECEVGN